METYSDLWAISQAWYDRISRGLFDADGERPAFEAARRSGKGLDSGGVSLRGNIAVLPVQGVLNQKLDFLTWLYGGTSTEVLGRTFEAMANDPMIDGIILDIDSPGGAYSGTPELANRIYQARGSKPIIAVANSQAASAAFWIATAADEVVVMPSGEVGSLGVIAIHRDFSRANEAAGITTTIITHGRNKAEFSPDQPLSDEARQELQRRVDGAGDLFVRDVAKQRGVPPSTVLAQFGQGRMYDAREAISRGMADRVGTLDETVEKLTRKLSPKSRSNRSASTGGIVAKLERERLKLRQYLVN
jgi:capsid assembly protease